MNRQKGDLLHYSSLVSGEEFEQFLVDFLLHMKNAELLGGTVVDAHVHGSSGQGQKGVDVFADIRPTGGGKLERIAFQCKNVKQSGWTVGKTKTAIKSTSHPADKYILVAATKTDGKVHAEVRKHPKWGVWFASDIESCFKASLNTDVGARLLTQYFGVGASLDILGFQGITPLKTGASFFEGINGQFSQDHVLVGREPEMKALRELMANDSKQFCILPGAGGQGKSRLLKEFASEQAATSSATVVRFIDSCTSLELESALLWLPPHEQLVLILDDAHKGDVALPDLFKVMRRRHGRLKAVIGTRPYRAASLESELVAADIGPDKILRLPVLKILSREARLTLARQCLGKDLERHANYLMRASDGSPLVITLGAAVIRGLGHAVALPAIADFRAQVFDRLADTKKLAAASGGLSQIMLDALLNLLSLLSPVRITQESAQRFAAFLSEPVRDVEHGIKLLREEQLLHERRKSSGETILRVMPDPLADYRVMSSCGGSSRSASLAVRAWREFGNDESRLVLLRNLAEAEWLARTQEGGAASLTQPIVEEALAEYRSCGTQRRHELLDLWRIVAVLHPETALQQVQLALRMAGDDPSGQDFAMIASKCDPILVEVARYQPAFVHRCLDMLWGMHPDQAPVDGGKLELGERDESAQPWGFVHRTCQFDRRGVTEVHREAIKWIAEKLSCPGSLPACSRFGEMLHQLLGWCFRLEWTEDQWAGPNTISSSHYSLSVKSTRFAREEALRIVCSWLRSSNAKARLAAARFFRSFLVPSGMHLRPRDGGRPVDLKNWREEKEKALHKLSGIIRATKDATTLWAIRHTLVQPFDHDALEKNLTIRKVLEFIPDSLDLRMHRLLLSNSWDDIPNGPRCLYKPVEDNARKEREWVAMADKTAGEVLAGHVDGKGLCSFLRKQVERLVAVDLRPSFAALFDAIWKAAPAMARQLVELALSEEEAFLELSFTSLICHSEAEPSERKAWRLRAYATSRPGLVRGAILALRFERPRTIPEGDEIAALQSVAAGSLSEAKQDILSWLSELRSAGEIDSAGIPVLSCLRIRKEDKNLQNALLACMQRWLNHEGLVAKISDSDALFKIFVPIPNLEQVGFDDLLGSWCRQQPEAVLSLLKLRIEEFKRQPDRSHSSYIPVPYGMHLSRLDETAEYGNLLAEAFRELLGKQAGTPDFACDYRWFDALALGGWKTYLQWLQRSLGEFDSAMLVLALGPGENHSMLAFSDPSLADALLKRASELDPETVKRIHRMIIRSVQPRWYGRQGREPFPHDVSNREKALELLRQHQDRPLLRALYQEILDGAIRSIEQTTKEDEKEQQEMEEEFEEGAATA